MAIPGDAVYRGKITVQNAKVSGSSDHSNFPVLLTEENFWAELMDAGSESATNGGGGLRFSSDEAGATQIAHEVVSFATSATESSRRAQVWVKAPTLSYSTDTDIHVWSSPTASEEAATSTYGRNAVWESRYEISAHFSETSGSTIVDSSGQRDGTYYGDLPQPGADFGQELLLDYTDFGSSDLGLSSGFRFAFHGKFRTVNSQMHLFTGDGRWQWKIKNEKINFTTIVGGVEEIVGSTTLVADTDYWIAATYDPVTGYEIFLNGSSDGSSSSTQVGDLAGVVSGSFGSQRATSSVNDYDGQAERFTVSTHADTRDSGWIATEYNNQSDPGTFAIAGTFQTGGGGTTLTLASASQPQSVSSPTLTQHNVMAVDSVSQAQTASQPTLTTGATLLTNPVDQAQTATQPALTQHNTLPVNSTTQSQTATAATLAQHHILLVDDTAQLQALTSPSLTQHQALTANPLNQSQTASEPTLTQAHILAVAGLSQTQTATAVTLAVAGVLSPAPLTQAQTAGIVTLIQAGVLGVDALSQSQTVTDPALLAKYTLIVDALAQSQALTQSTLSIADVLAVADVTQTQSAGSVTLITPDTLLPDGTSQAQSVDTAPLTQHGVLAVDSLTQAQLLSISQGGAVLGWLDGTLVIVAALGGTLTINPAR